jgi:hypothetical protein
MRSRIGALVAALVLGLVSTVAAQVAPPAVQGAPLIDTGTVVRIDPQASVVMLEDGRMYRVTPNTVFLVDNRPAQFATLRPGERIAIQAGEPVIYREGRYIAMQPVAPPPVVTQAPPPAVYAPAVPVGVRQTLYGKVTDVDNNGTIKIKTDRDDFEARVAPDATRQIRKGDNVVIDLTISPPGAASPR